MSTAHGKSACIRCRKRKKRCDQRLPRCRLCELAGVECYGYDVATQRQMPRSYVQSLEERLALLESRRGTGEAHEAHEASRGIRPDTSPSGAVSPPMPSEQPAGNLSLVSPVVDTSPLSAGSMGGDPGSTGHGSDFSRILLTGMLSPPSFASSSLDAIAAGLDTGPVTLPTRDTAQMLMREYFRCCNIGMPLLHEPTLEQKVHLVYALPPQMAGDAVMGINTTATAPAAAAAAAATAATATATTSATTSATASSSAVIDLDTTHTSESVRLALFFVFEVFAVALLALQKRDPGRIIPTWLADRYHKIAVRALLAAGLPRDVEGVQALLLVGQFYYFHPTLWVAYDTTGMALRLAVELGLHREPAASPSSSAASLASSSASSPPLSEHHQQHHRQHQNHQNLDALELDNRRRTFWVAYSMERNMTTSKSMPHSLSDGAIDVHFPSEVDDKYITAAGIPPAQPPVVSGAKLLSIHIFRYRQIQSEMRVALHERPPSLYAPFFYGPSAASNGSILDTWQKQMHARIDRWYAAIRQSSTVDALSAAYSKGDRDIIEVFELTYHRALFNLHRPTPNIPEPRGSQRVAMAQAAVQMIRLYRRFFLEHKITIYWQAVDNLSAAGTQLVLAYRTCPGVRSYLTHQTLASVAHVCSSVLWGMVERFPAFRDKRDAFDTAAASVLGEQPAGERVSSSLTPPPSLSTVASVSAASATSMCRPAEWEDAAGGNNRRPDLSDDTGLSQWAAVSGDFGFHANQPPQLPASFTDFGDLAVVWDAGMDLGTMTSAWI